MLYTRTWVLKNINPQPPWNGFNSYSYAKFDMSIDECINRLRICWNDPWMPWGDNRPTFLEAAKCFFYNPNLLPGKEKWTMNYAYPNNDIDIPGFLIADLKKENWPAPHPYPSTMTIDENSYVAEDRNHRLLAIAFKIVQGTPLNIKASLYLGNRS